MFRAKLERAGKAKLTAFFQVSHFVFDVRSHIDLGNHHPTTYFPPVATYCYKT